MTVRINDSMPLSRSIPNILMISYIRNGTHSGMRRMTSSKKSNQIPGHGKKCEVLNLSRYPLEFSYRVNNKVVPAKDFCRDLGVYVDKGLTFHQLCLNVARIAH